MPRLVVENFDGIIPRTEPHQLGDNQAQVAQNAKLYASDLRPWRGTAQDILVTARTNALTIYKLYNYAGASTWLQFLNDVDVALSPTVDTGDVRFYYTGDGSPRKSNYALAQGTNPPHAYYEMGVPAPVAAPTLTLTVAGSGSNQTRAYVYTFVHAFGTLEEESAPSPPTTITANVIGSTVHLSLFDTPPAGNYNWTKIRIYRSVTGNSTASYQFVAEIPLATTTYDDTLTVAQLGEALSTLGWRPPPTDLTGIVNLGSASGVLAGFSGNTVCFSEPFFPHAWPLAYQIALPYKIVGVGAVGSSLVVATDRYPYIISGGVPGQMQVERVQLLEPCVSKKSIASYADGVVYASPNGLVTIGASARDVSTRALFHREEWQALVPSGIIGAIYDTRYIATFTTGPQAGTAYVLDPTDTPALSQVDMLTAKAVHVDSKTGSVWLINTAYTGIFQLDIDQVNLLTYTWRSKKWNMPIATSWSVCKVRGDYTTGAANIALYVDGALVTTITPTDDQPIRLPPFTAREFFFEVVGTRRIQQIQFATSVRELV